MWEAIRLSIITQAEGFFIFYGVGCVQSDEDEYDLHCEQIKGFPS